MGAVEQLPEMDLDSLVHPIRLPEGEVPDDLRAASSCKRLTTPIKSKDHVCVILYTECIDDLLSDMILTCPKCSRNATMEKRYVGTSLVLVWVSTNYNVIYSDWLLHTYSSILQILTI